MTTPAPEMPQMPQMPPVDRGNAILGETPAVMAVTPANTPAGPRLLLTIRTPSTTLTIFLDRDNALAWARHLRNTAQGTSPLIVPNGVIGNPVTGIQP